MKPSIYEAIWEKFLESEFVVCIAKCNSILIATCPSELDSACFERMQYLAKVLLPLTEALEQWEVSYEYARIDELLKKSITALHDHSKVQADWFTNAFETFILAYYIQVKIEDMLFKYDFWWLKKEGYRASKMYANFLEACRNHDTWEEISINDLIAQAKVFELSMKGLGLLGELG